MRLTEKLSNGYIIDTKLNYADSVVEMIQKLGQLEDIEEELGYELQLLVKVSIAEKIYVKKYRRYYEIDGVDVKTGEVFLHKDNKEPFMHIVNLKFDYGKTWALTKEELL